MNKPQNIKQRIKKVLSEIQNLDLETKCKTCEVPNSCPLAWENKGKIDIEIRAAGKYPNKEFRICSEYTKGN